LGKALNFFGIPFTNLISIVPKKDFLSQCKTPKFYLCKNFCQLKLQFWKGRRETFNMRDVSFIHLLLSTLLITLLALSSCRKKAILRFVQAAHLALLCLVNRQQQHERKKMFRRMVEKRDERETRRLVLSSLTQFVRPCGWPSCALHYRKTQSDYRRQENRSSRGRKYFQCDTCACISPKECISVRALTRSASLFARCVRHSCNRSTLNIDQHPDTRSSLT